ncbi:MAG: MBL fold metallo-hydrolase [bacterium]|nr:MBL fold metallo-hydrolase [bacterium]
MAGPRPYRIMVDCGMEFVREDELGIGGIGPIPDFSLLQGDNRKIDAVFLTHAHVDHIGSIGALCSGGYLAPEAKIYCSPQTYHIVPIALNDGLRNHPQFSVFDAAETISRLAVIPEPGEFEILPGLKVYIPQRGHIPGNGGIVIPLASGKKGYLTSDECWHDQPVVQASLLPSQSWPIEWLPDEIWGTDLTYGLGAPSIDAKPKPTVDEEVARLIESVRTGLGNGRKQTIAAFGTGRIQNVAVWLAKAGIRVYIDGVGRHIYRIFQENRWSERDNRLPKLGEGSGIIPVESTKHREHLINGPEPCVVVTTGGMGDFGPIVAYLETGIRRADFDFYFTSWLAPGSNGHKLVKASRKIEPDKGQRRVNLKLGENKPYQWFPLKANIDHFALSAHSPMGETVKFLQDVANCRHGQPLDRIVLTHGVQENKALAARLFMPFSRQIMYGERNTTVSLS